MAGQPGSVGIIVHNAGYEALSLNYRYVAIGSDDINPIVMAIRTLGFRGLAVSMPFKQSVIPLLDAETDEVAAIGACNTIVNDQGMLVGHNTDWLGALGALKEVRLGPLSRAVIIGAGGVARAIAYMLRSQGTEVFVCARNVDCAKRLVKELSLAGAASIGDQGRFAASLVVNATPNAQYPGGPVNLEEHNTIEALMDVVYKQRRTPLAIEAERRECTVIPGWRIYLHQALRQFELYTGREAPAAVMNTILEKTLSD